VPDADALAAQRALHGVADGVDLGRRAPRADEEKVRQRGHALQIEDDEILRPLVEGGLGGQPHQGLSGAGHHAPPW
jgi:hypothetical protein